MLDRTFACSFESPVFWSKTLFYATGWYTLEQGWPTRYPRTPGRPPWTMRVSSRLSWHRPVYTMGYSTQYVCIKRVVPQITPYLLSISKCEKAGYPCSKDSPPGAWAIMWQPRIRMIAFFRGKLAPMFPLFLYMQKLQMVISWNGLVFEQANKVTPSKNPLDGKESEDCSRYAIVYSNRWCCGLCLALSRLLSGELFPATSWLIVWLSRKVIPPWSDFTL